MVGHEVVGIEHVHSGKDYRLVFADGKTVVVTLDGLETGSESAHELRFHTHVCREVRKILDWMHFSHGVCYRYDFLGNLVLWTVSHDDFSAVLDVYGELQDCGFCKELALYVRLRHPAWSTLFSISGGYHVFPYLENDRLIPEPGMYLVDGNGFVKIGDHRMIDEKRLVREFIRIRRELDPDESVVPEWYVDETVLWRHIRGGVFSGIGMTYVR